MSLRQSIARIRAVLRGWGGELLLVAMLLAFAAWSRPPAWDEIVALEPRPDALEYCVSALHWASGHGFVLRIGDNDYPPRWEPGFPLVLAAWYRLVGTQPARAALLQSILCVTAIGLLYVAVRQFGSRLTAAFAGLLLCFSGLHLEWSRTLMSECLMVALVSGILLNAAMAHRESRGPWFFVGLLAGWATIVRPTQLAGVACVLLIAAFQKSRRRTLVPCLVGASLVLIPWFVFHWVRFGSPLANGYDYWLGDVARPSRLFSAEHLFRTAGSKGNIEFYSRALVHTRFGAWPWAGIALAVVGVISRCRAMALAVGALALPAIAFLFYAWSDLRFFATLIPFLGFATAFGAERLTSAPNRWIRAAGFCLVAGALAQALLQWRLWPAPPLNRNARELKGLAVAQKLLQPGDVLISDAPLVLVGWAAPQVEALALSSSGDEHLQRIHNRGLLPLSRRKSGERQDSGSGSGVSAFLTAELRRDPEGSAVLRAAWRRSSKVYLMLSSAREQWLANLRYMSGIPKGRLDERYTDADVQLFEMRPPERWQQR